MHCVQCGTELKQKANFCQSCGSKIDAGFVKQINITPIQNLASTSASSNTSRGLKPWILLLLATGGYILGATTGDIIGTTFNASATICVIFAIVRYIRKSNK